jgi:hypothetical protein
VPFGITKCAPGFTSQYSPERELTSRCNTIGGRIAACMEDDAGYVTPCAAHDAVEYPGNQGFLSQVLAPRSSEYAHPGICSISAITHLTCINTPSRRTRAVNRRAGPRAKWGPTKWAGPGRVSPLSDRFRANFWKPGCLIGAGGRPVCRDADRADPG